MRHNIDLSLYVWTTDRPAEIPDDDPCASVPCGKGGTDGIDLKEQFCLCLERGIAQDGLQTGFVLLSYTE